MCDPPPPHGLDWSVEMPSLISRLEFTLGTSFVGGAVAQSVERATPDEEVPSSIPAEAARSVLVGSVPV